MNVNGCTASNMLQFILETKNSLKAVFTHVFKIAVLTCSGVIAAMASARLLHLQKDRWKRRKFTQMLNISFNELKFQENALEAATLANKKPFTFRFRTLSEEPVKKVILDDHGKHLTFF